MAGASASGGTPGTLPPELGIEIATQMEPSALPPGGLAPSQVPQFIVLGFDDNRYVDGMQWVLELIETRANPAGTGNTRTYDGQKLVSSFYFTSDSLELGGETLLAEWRRAAQGGHEVANHTHTHRALENEGVVWDWVDEISECNSILESELGVPAGSILGVRAPFLQFDQNLFDVIQLKILKIPFFIFPELKQLKLKGDF
jgi:hypothetical protein